VTKGSTPALFPSDKKQLNVSSPNPHIACFLVEGCKDYHMHHKVCEMHSKASRAMATGSSNDLPVVFEVDDHFLSLKVSKFVCLLLSTLMTCHPCFKLHIDLHDTF
jgi:hypothetical protein